MIGANLKAAREKMGMSQTLLGEKLGATQNTVWRWENDRITPDDDTKLKMAQILNVSVAYLMGEHPAPTHANGGKILRSDKLLMIPHISPEVRVSAGTGNAYEDIQWEVIERYPVFDGPLSAMYGDDDLTCITVEGDSMEPQIHDGDIVVFNHCSDWLSGNIYVVCHNGRLLVKGLVSDGIDKPPILRSVNKEYPDIKIKDDDFFLVYGRVLRIETSRKPKPVI